MPNETSVKDNLKKEELLTQNMQPTNDTKVTPIKKKPPPIMQKPEKSDEILRKLGRSPPTDPNQVPTTNSVQPMSNCIPSSNSSNFSSTSSSTPTNTNSSLNGSVKTNMSVRLSNSKATDV